MQDLNPGRLVPAPTAWAALWVLGLSLLTCPALSACPSLPLPQPLALSINSLPGVMCGKSSLSADCPAQWFCLRPAPTPKALAPFHHQAVILEIDSPCSTLPPTTHTQLTHLLSMGLYSPGSRDGSKKPTLGSDLGTQFTSILHYLLYGQVLCEPQVGCLNLSEPWFTSLNPKITLVTPSDGHVDSSGIAKCPAAS